MEEASRVAASAAATLDAALRILRADTPAAFYRLADELRGLAVGLEVEGERFTVLGLDAAVRVDPAIDPTGAPDGRVRVRTTRRTILALIDGRKTFLEAVLDRDLTLHAELDLLPRLSRAMACFVEGAVRTRRMRGLLNEFRAASPQAPSPALPSPPPSREEGGRGRPRPRN